jgi:hypothetical protein
MLMAALVKARKRLSDMANLVMDGRKFQRAGRSAATRISAHLDYQLFNEMTVQMGIKCIFNQKSTKQ